LGEEHTLPHRHVARCVLCVTDRISLPARRRLTLDAVCEGYPDRPGRASSKEGES